MYTPSASHEVGSEPIYKQLGVLQPPLEAEPLQAVAGSNLHLQLSPLSYFALVIEHPSLHGRNPKETAGASPSPSARAPRTSLIQQPDRDSNRGSQNGRRRAHERAPQEAPNMFFIQLPPPSASVHSTPDISRPPLTWCNHSMAECNVIRCQRHRMA